MDIEEMVDCQHTVRCLHKSGITTMEELATFTKQDLLSLRGIGKVIATDLEAIIEAYRGKMALEGSKGGNV